MQNQFRSTGSYSSGSAFRFQEVLFHEAGHATVAEVYRPGTVDHILVNRDGSGHCAYLRAPSPFPGSDSGRWGVMLTLGGKAAVEQYLNVVGEGCDSDFEHARSTLNRTLAMDEWLKASEYGAYAGPDLDTVNRDAALSAEMNRLFSKTKEILAVNGSLLTALVSELSRKKYLSAREIAEIERRFPPVPVSL